MCKLVERYLLQHEGEQPCNVPNLSLKCAKSKSKCTESKSSSFMHFYTKLYLSSVILTLQPGFSMFYRDRWPKMGAKRKPCAGANYSCKCMYIHICNMVHSSLVMLHSNEWLILTFHSLRLNVHCCMVCRLLHSILIHVDVLLAAGA